MRKIRTKEYISMLKQLTEDGKEVSMIITGSSMSPFLIHERDVIWFKKPNRELKKGDMVFFQRANGQYVMHRIQKVIKEDFYLIGDGQTEIEGPIHRNTIWAIVTQVRRKGKMLHPGDFWWEFFEHVWINLIPIRGILQKIYAMVTD